MGKPSLLPVGAGLLGVSLVWQIYNAYVPLFLQAGRPDFAEKVSVRGFALDTTTSGFVMTLDNLAALLILPFVGILSDRWGKRKAFVAVGAPIAALGMALVPFTLGTFPLFLLALGLVILAMDIFRTPLTALLADLCPPDERSRGNGIVMLGYGLGSVVAFVLGGKLFERSPAAPFLLAAGGMLLAGLAVTFFVREPKPAPSPETESPQNFLSTLRGIEPTVGYLLGAAFAWTLGVSALEVFFTSFAAKAFSLDGGKAMSLMGFFGIAGIVGAIPAGLLGTRFGRGNATIAGLALLVVILPLVGGVRSLDMLRVMLVLMGLSWSLVQVNALPLILDYAPEGRAGAFTGTFLMAGQLASVVGPILSGWFIGRFSTDYRALFVYVPITMAVAIGLLVVSRLRASAANAERIPSPIREPLPDAP